MSREVVHWWNRMVWVPRSDRFVRCCQTRYTLDYESCVELFTHWSCIHSLHHALTRSRTTTEHTRQTGWLLWLLIGSWIERLDACTTTWIRSRYQVSLCQLGTLLVTSFGIPMARPESNQIMNTLVERLYSHSKMHEAATLIVEGTFKRGKAHENMKSKHRLFHHGSRIIFTWNTICIGK